jgi:DNA-directed RNA polymerase sigma subunit (sigma70/sigma32)
MFIKGVFDFLADVTGNPVEIEAQSMTLAGWAALFDVVARELKTINPREEKVIRLYYGIDDGERKQPEQIGAQACIGASSPAKRAEEVRHETLRKLRHPERLQRIQNFLFPKIISFKELTQNFNFCSMEVSGEVKNPEERFITRKDG